MPPYRHACPFVFARDAFGFANELVWHYRFDPVTGAMTTFRRDASLIYTHRCFVMVRSARQFLYHARFDPTQSAISDVAYRALIRQIVSRSPRHPSPASARVVVPAYDGLRAFSQDRIALLQSNCGGPWESYFVRSHWRMVFPVWPAHQAWVARRLEQSLPLTGTAVVHLFRFPHITINHGIVLWGLTATPQRLEFDAYDPNIPDHPVRLTFDRARRAFTFPPTHYWGGGPLSVVEIFHGRWL